MIVELEEAYGRIGDSISYEFRIVSEERLADFEDVVLLAQIKTIQQKAFCLNLSVRGVYIGFGALKSTRL